MSLCYDDVNSMLEYFDKATYANITYVTLCHVYHDSYENTTTKNKGKHHTLRKISTA